MNIQDYILNYPDISEKDSKYCLFIGIVAELRINEVIEICDFVFDEDILKRKIFIRNINYKTKFWSIHENGLLFDKLYNLLRNKPSYYKKESISLALNSICASLPKVKLNKLIKYFMKSGYINDRKRAYMCLKNHWLNNYEKDILKSWEYYHDDEALKLIINNMSTDVLRSNYDKLREAFSEENLEYNFLLKNLRNKLYAKIFNKNSKEINDLKTKDIISYLYIMRIQKESIDENWLYEFYKANKDKRYLSWWLADFDLWHKILEKNIDPLEEKLES